MDNNIYNIFNKGLYRINSSSYSVVDEVSNNGVANINPDQLGSGGSTEQMNMYVGAIVSGKQGFTNTESGYILGVDADDGIPKFYIGNSSNYLNWDGTTLSVAGSITLTSGSIAGMTISSTALTATSGGNQTILSSGATAFSAGPTGSPTVTITQAGVLTATGAVITGTITATTGTIGGFTLSATALTATNLIIDSSGQRISLGSGNDIVILDADDATYRIWTGHATAASAPFSVTKAGLVAASNIVISGTASTFNGSLITNVQPRAEILWSRDYFFVGAYDDGLTATVSAGATITRSIMSTLFAINGAANSNAKLSVTILGSTVSGGTMDWGTGDYEFSCSGQYRDTSAQDSFLGLYDGGGTPSNNLADVNKHIGFYLQDGTMYASNANGTTQTTTNISASITITNMNDLRFVYDTGVNILFYVNDTLVATHTTNLPASAGGNYPAPVFFLNASDGDSAMIIKNNYIVTLEI